MNVSDAKPGQLLRCYPDTRIMLVMGLDDRLTGDGERWWRVLDCTTNRRCLLAEKRTPYFVSIEDSELVVDV